MKTVATAPRPASTRGLSLAVLGNTEGDAAILLRATIRQLVDHGITFASITYYDKHHCFFDAAPELIAQIAAENDIALTAMDDCGSCCTACINDAVRLERSGVPTVAIVTTEFEREARLQRDLRGMVGLEPAVASHPISSLTIDQLDSRAAEIAPQARHIWFGPKASLAEMMFETAA